MQDVYSNSSIIRGRIALVVVNRGRIVVLVIKCTAYRQNGRIKSVTFRSNNFGDTFLGFGILSPKIHNVCEMSSTAWNMKKQEDNKKLLELP